MSTPVFTLEISAECGAIGTFDLTSKTLIFGLKLNIYSLSLSNIEDRISNLCLFIFISSSSVKTGFGGLGPSQFSST
jgi:hypothetical protein